jgi:hypothetical protein
MALLQNRSKMNSRSLIKLVQIFEKFNSYNIISDINAEIRDSLIKISRGIGELIVYGTH